MTRVHVALALALGATLTLSAGLAAPGKSGGHAGGASIGHAGPHISISHGAAGFTRPTATHAGSLIRGSSNPVLLPAWRGSAVRTGMGLGVSTGWAGRFGGVPGTVVVSPVGDKAQAGPEPVVNNGGSFNRQYLTGVVVAVRPDQEGGAGGTIQLRLAREELPVINGKQEETPSQDVTVRVSDATSFRARGQKGEASLGDVHLGETVRVGLDGRLTREVEVLGMSGGR